MDGGLNSTVMLEKNGGNPNNVGHGGLTWEYMGKDLIGVGTSHAVPTDPNHDHTARRRFYTYRKRLATGVFDFVERDSAADDLRMVVWVVFKEVTTTTTTPAPSYYSNTDPFAWCNDHPYPESASATEPPAFRTEPPIEETTTTLAPTTLPVVITEILDTAPPSTANPVLSNFGDGPIFVMAPPPNTTVAPRPQVAEGERAVVTADDLKNAMAKVEFELEMTLSSESFAGLVPVTVG